MNLNINYKGSKLYDQMLVQSPSVIRLGVTTG